MQRQMLKSKIHRATVTQAELNYEGSLTVDTAILEAADIKEFEKVQVVNLNNGNRFETYTIPGKRNSGIICLNGPAARLGTVGDEVIIITYCNCTEEELKKHKPKVVYVDKKNRVKKIKA
ncbi:MAG: aspartate 1-decarboxylase [Ignavibacteria bacterium]|nr:aspartate 1-decarboxylase [Ignavibacteria bacterium]